MKNTYKAHFRYLYYSLINLNYPKDLTYYSNQLPINIKVFGIKINA